MIMMASVGVPRVSDEGLDQCPSISFVVLVPQNAVRCAWALGTFCADGAQHASGGCRRAQVSAGILVRVHMKCMSPYSIHTISKRMDFPCECLCRRTDDHGIQVLVC